MTETKLEIEFMGGCYETMNNHVLVDLVHKNMQEAPQDDWSDEEIKFAKTLNATTPHLKERAINFLKLTDDVELHTGVGEIGTVGNFGSTDVGDVHHMAPGVFFSTACYNIGAPGHSWQITSCSGSTIGEKGMTYAARVMAKFGLDLIEKPEILEKAWDEFRASMGGKEYKCPIPEGLPVPGQEYILYTICESKSRTFQAVFGEVREYNKMKIALL
jgi:aminobenzoyl-glutamate utilization protein B